MRKEKLFDNNVATFNAPIDDISKATIIKLLPKGEQIDILEEVSHNNTQWLKIQTSDGVISYILGSTLIEVAVKNHKSTSVARLLLYAFVLMMPFMPVLYWKITPSSIFSPSLSAKDIFTAFVNWDGNKGNMDDVVFIDGTILKKGYGGIPDSVGGEFPMYLAKVQMREGNTTSTMLIYYTTHANPLDNTMAWRGEQFLPAMLDLMKREDFHEKAERIHIF